MVHKNIITSFLQMLILLILFTGCGTTSTVSKGSNASEKSSATSIDSADMRSILSLPKPQIKTEVSVNLRHSGNLKKLLVTKDGRYALSSSSDASIKIWDINNRTHIRTLTGHEKDVRDIILSPDEKLIYSVSPDKSIRIWDFETGKMLKTYENTADKMYGIAQGRTATELFIAVYDDNNFTGVYSFDLLTGNKSIYFDGTEHYCTGFTYSKDHKLAFSNYEPDPDSKDSREGIAVWDIKKGKIIETYISDVKRLDHITISDNNRYIAASNDKNKFFIWDRKSGDEKYTEENRFGKSDNISDMEFSHDNLKLYVSALNGLYEFEKDNRGKFCHAFTGNYPYKYKGLGSLIKILSGKSEMLIMEKQFHLLKLEKAFNLSKKLYSFSGEDSIAWGGTYGRNTEYFLSDHSGGWALWNLEEGLKETELRPAPAESRWLSREDFHAESGRAVASQKGIIYWDVKTGEIIHHLPYKGELFVCDLKFTADGKQIVSGYKDGTIRFWDLETGKVKKKFNSGIKSIKDIDLSSDEKLLAAISKNDTIKVWNLKTGETIYLATLFTDADIIRFSPDNESLFLNIKGNIYRYSYKNKTSSLATTKNIEVMKTYKGHKYKIEAINFSPDGSRMLTLGSDKSFIVWETESGKILYRKSLPYDAENGSFSDDGKRIHIAVRDGIFRLYEAETGKLISLTFSGPGKEAVTWTPDGYFAGEGQVVNKAVSLTKGLKSYAIDQFAVFKNRPDIILERRGSRNETLKNEYFRHYLKRLISYNLLPEEIPQDLWESILNNAADEDKILLQTYYSKGTLKSEYSTQKDILLKDRYRLLHISSYLKYLEDFYNTDLHTPEGEIKKLTRIDSGGQENPEGEHVKIDISFTDSKYPLKSYNIYINGVALFGIQGKQLTENQKELIISETIQLTPGSNRIEVSCFNNRMAESFRFPSFIDLNKEEQGSLYFIGFGVSEYNSPEIADLRYADDDIMDLEKLFLSLTSYKKVHTLTLTNSDVTAESIKSAKDFISSAEANDTLIVAAAGHGLHDDDVNSSYYFLTADTDLENLKGTAADFTWIEELLTGENSNAPRKKILLLDTCQSGDFAPWMDSGNSGLASLKGSSRSIHARSIIPEGNMKSRGLKVRKKQITWTIDEGRYILNDLSRRSGAVVFSSCKGNEFSYEDDSLKNGYFTSAFISAFKSHEGEKNLDLRKLIDSVKKVVKEKISVQTPTVDKDNMHMNFSFPLP